MTNQTEIHDTHTCPCEMCKWVDENSQINDLSRHQTVDILECIVKASEGESKSVEGIPDLKSHLALYGNTGIIRAYCQSCQRWAFVIDDTLQCCMTLTEAAPKKIVRESEPEARRRKPSVKEQTRILEAQNHRCLYCDVSLAGYVIYHGELKKVKLTWDHMTPYAYCLDNHHENFAATCQFCNSWKSSLVFKTVEEVRVYVAVKWEEEGRKAKAVSGVPDEF